MKIIKIITKFIYNILFKIEDNINKQEDDITIYAGCINCPYYDFYQHSCSKYGVQFGEIEDYGNCDNK